MIRQNIAIFRAKHRRVSPLSLDCACARVSNTYRSRSMEEKGVSPPMDESRWAEELENVDAPKRERHIKLISYLLLSKVS